ncbi:hypothetical protein I0566_001425 [Staphylococcus pseudintermedius]|uniref:hypothetical protein n=1 Tax=Staphylococcus pseudintermedius TaxID=283734 RepID=UPI0019E3A419|nr:hypothetical protein [Staphylococcus pseudintermedius]EGQ2900047.1 hypothetical protein [Staphylococcus pseudintermedius]EGQ3545447.1 hypothetical protein [Staphylococcus pseudintermedius]EIX6332290.1 hypothetical protein [Staphylococcus pseudintermedius]EJD8474550.1 hypothetical protein [Staphylococcus pseudintermedius]MCC8294706.1 hypothetical protein [Staphylococcus pseudintermedius]
MKTKTKKEMNLHELIQWAWENDVKGKTFKSNRGKKVKFYSIGGFNVMEPIWGHDIFNVEVEEEITEETEIPVLVELFMSGLDEIIHTYHRTSIGEAIGEVHKGAEALPTAFYMLNDDMTMTLIWKDGELVE